MFQQLLMNLPYSPSLLKQVGFYSKRLRQEEFVRKLGFIIMTMAFFMQVIAFLQPPEAAIATSPANDLGDGVFSRNTIKNLYDTDPITKAVYDFYGINEMTIDSCTNATINANQNSFIFVGLQAHGSNGEVTRTYQNQTFYERNLTGPDYRVFSCEHTSGAIFINLGSGNPILAGSLTENNGLVSDSPVQIKLSVRNKIDTDWLDANSPESAATGFRVGDWITYKFDVTNTSQRVVKDVFVDESWHFLKYLQKATEPDWVNIEMEKNGYPNWKFDLSPGEVKTISWRVRAPEWMATNSWHYNFVTIDSYDGKSLYRDLTDTEKIGLADVAKVVVGDPHVEVELRKEVRNVNGQWVEAQTANALDTPSFLVGDTVQWRVVVENLSTDPASGITVSDTFDNTQLQPLNPDVFPWNVGALEPGQTKVSSAFRTKVLKEGSIKNTATITSINETSDEPSNNTDPAWLNTRKPEVEVSLKKYVKNTSGSWSDAGVNNGQVPTDLNEYKVGDTVQWRVAIEASNANEANATGVVVEDTFRSSDMQIVGDNPFPLSVGDLAPGQDKEIIFTTKLTSPGTKQNVATVSLNETTDDPTNNEDPAFVLVNAPQYEISLNKQVQAAGGWAAADNISDNDVPTYVIGEEYSYRLTLSADQDNDGTATSILVQDNLPSQLEYISHNGDGDYDKDAGLWTIDSIQQGEAVSLVINVKASAVANTTNTAEIVSFDQIEYDSLDNNQNPANVVTALPAPEVELSLRKQVKNGDEWLEANQADVSDVPTFLLGDEVEWRIVVKNISNRDASGIVVQDDIPNGLTKVDFGSLSDSGEWSVGNLDAGQQKEITFTTKVAVNSPLTNVASIVGLNENGDDPTNNSDPANIKVKERCAIRQAIAADDPDCQVCPVNDSLWYKDENCKGITCDALRVVNVSSRTNFVLEGEVSIHNGNIEEFIYIVVDVDGNEIETIVNQNSDLKDEVNISLSEPGAYVVGLAIKSDIGSATSNLCSAGLKIADIGECRYIGHPGLTENDEQCLPCPLFPNYHVNSDRCNNPVVLSKKAANITQNIADANGTTANPGDTITYRLTTTNLSNLGEVKVDVSEKLADVLEYATLETYSEDGKLDDKTLSWGEVLIPAGESIEHVITVKIMNEVPATAQGSTASSQARYDLNLNNVYGNSINIKLDPPSFAKQVEGVVDTLPNTGAGTATLIAAITATVVTYFYARARQLRKELDLVRHEGGF